MRMVLRMKCENSVLAAEMPCERKFATKFASDCECDGLVHSDIGVCVCVWVESRMVWNGRTSAIAK